MFFPPPRGPCTGRMCPASDLCVQTPPMTFGSTPAKSLPLLGAMKKTTVPATVQRLRLPSSVVPSIGPDVYDPSYHPSGFILPDLRLWPQLDSRLVRLNAPLMPPSSPTVVESGIMNRPPFFPSSFPHFDVRFAAPTNYGRKLFRCPQCRYLTDRRNNLKRHVLTMHQTCSKMLECCGIAFNTKASLREHSMIFHYNGYTCNFCGRRFCRKALLKRHLSVHSGQKDYICPVCDYATSHKSNLERHRKVHLRQGGDGDPEDFIVTSSDGESPGKPASKSSETITSEDLSSDDDSDWEINVVSTQEEEEEEKHLPANSGVPSYDNTTDTDKYSKIDDIHAAPVNYIAQKTTDIPTNAYCPAVLSTQVSRETPTNVLKIPSVTKRRCDPPIDFVDRHGVDNLKPTMTTAYRPYIHDAASTSPCHLSTNLTDSSSIIKEHNNESPVFRIQPLSSRVSIAPISSSKSSAGQHYTSNHGTEEPPCKSLKLS